MDDDEFKRMLGSVKRTNPVWFELPGEPPASRDEVSNAEASLELRFPASYRSFLKEYGGGCFAFVNVFSVRAESEWNVVLRNREANIDNREFLAISDGGTGDFYGFQVVDGECQSNIVLWDHEANGHLSTTPYADLYEFLVEVGLRK